MGWGDHDIHGSQPLVLLSYKTCIFSNAEELQAVLATFHDCRWKESLLTACVPREVLSVCWIP